ncbi:hypothetical protein MRB53_030387 [Persea americana]|uniref:Uncharacterized protein n=1 Tax=Persea americana TaxID=3435 RepID=A0ACC2KLE7_PERAE|nr:hypothetical protein MRB53_030387 [Persea americana]
MANISSTSTLSHTLKQVEEEEDGISSTFPLQLIRSHPIPPAPNGSDSSIDFLHDFAGFSWIAYAASSLLVISHFPSPLSQEQTLIGPIFRQVLQPPCGGDGPADVKAVAWSPYLPSDGEIAAASENRICLYSAEPGAAEGSFFWRQISGLVQSSAVEAMQWTASGDGLIAAGILEVVLWKKENKIWEVAWKTRTEAPQTLVAATWTIEGPAATAARAFNHPGGQHFDLSSLPREASRCVLIYYGDGKSGFVKLELCHPQPVTMIQWRPSTVIASKSYASHSRREVLLTCCLDGTVRLWCEIDSGRSRKPVKDASDQKTIKRSFHVAAVIEMNQLSKGTLGTDAFIRWAVDVRDLIGEFQGLRDCFPSEVSEFDTAGRCEWLIGVGPDSSLTFWAIHFLDDLSPLRFPRITLWKKQNLLDFPAGHVWNTSNPNSRSRPIFVQAAVLRSQLSGPPTMCSFLLLQPDNSIYWSQLYNPVSGNAEDGILSEASKESYLSCFSSGNLNQDGHTGHILQVAVHPFNCEVELVVSLDSNGLLLFWSLPTTNCNLGLPTLVNPTWKLLGRIATHDLLTNVAYSTLRWAPSVLNEKQILLMGHGGGIDCFMIIISGSEGEELFFHKICTIPFPGHSHGDGPDHIYTTALPSTCTQSFISDSFILIGIWMKEFLALSWKVVVHSEDLNGSSCACGFNTGNVATPKAQMYECAFDGRRYCVVANLCSSELPDPHSHDQVTSVAVACPDNWMPSVQRKWPFNGLCNNASTYQMATGCSDGSLKLWRICQVESSTSHFEGEPITWELVGKFTANQGPIRMISVSSCGSKIATISTVDSDSSDFLHIWESVCLTGVGNFFQEDSIPLDGSAVALDWLAVGNGQLLLGVCMRNELRIYAQKSLWSSCIDVTSQFNFYSKCTKERPAHCIGEIDKYMFYSVYTGDICNTKASPADENDRGCELPAPADINMKNEYGFCNFCLTISQQQYEFFTNGGLHNMLERVENLCGPLPIYHPEAVFQCLCSGNWKRAYVAVHHLVECLGSAETSDKCGEANSFRKPCNIIPQIQLSQYFGGLSSSIHDKGLQWGGGVSSDISGSLFERSLFPLEEVNSTASFSGNMLGATSGKSEITRFIEALEKSHDLTAIMNMDKAQILAMVDLLGEVCDSCYSSAYESFDDPGRRFWAVSRFQQLYFLRKFGRSAVAEELVIDSSSIAWAFQSDCHDNLFSSLLPNEPSWLEMRSLGVGYWFTNAAGLRTKMEKLARLQYLKKKDPKDCALLYLALNRLQVLTGLFKVSKNEKDKPLVGFLSRNFQEEKNKAAALKNAYVLMGKHQLELAIAFFLLGGDASSAVSICAKNLGDEQLALVICRLVEGYGGPLERHLISTFLLPTAVEKGNYWLASMLEWALGNYSESFRKLISSRTESTIDKEAIRCSYAAFADPSISQYCALLASKTSMKNSVGEYTAGILSRWATWMTASTLNRCGFPLEALACLSSSLNAIEGKDQISLSDVGKLTSFHEILSTSHYDANWLLGDVAYRLESYTKTNLAMQYISKLLLEHPNWPETHLASSCAPVFSKEYETGQYELLMERFEHKLNTGVALLDQKYSLESVGLLNKVLIFAYNNGLLLLGYSVLHGYASRKHPHNNENTVDNFILYPSPPKLLLKAGEEVSFLLVRYVVASCISCSPMRQAIHRRDSFFESRSGRFHAWYLCLQDVIFSSRSITPLLKFYSSNFLPEDISVKIFATLDLLEYFLYFALAWSQRNPKELIQDALSAYEGNTLASNFQDVHSESTILAVPDDGKWLVIGVCLWWHLSNLSNGHLYTLMTDFEVDCSNIPVCGGPSWPSCSADCQSNLVSTLKPIKLFPMILAKLLRTTLAYVSQSLSKHLLSFLEQKVEKGLPVPVLGLLEEDGQIQPRALHNILRQGSETLKANNADGIPFYEILWEVSVNLKDIRESFLLEKIKGLRSVAHKLSNNWIDIHKGIMAESEHADTINHQVTKSSSSITDTGSAARNLPSGNSNFMVTRQKNAPLLREVPCFQNPKEIFKKSGELIEAMCVNSLDRQQGALASNRKGLIFFNFKVEEPSREQAEYIWSETDWPKNGWAGSESTPIPTFVSPGIGLGSKKGAHLGLGGATIGRGTLARPGRDLTGGGAFGIPGYAGVGASGLGWGEQEDFEFVDPPATVQNISTRALSSHPSRPLFLVGSSNTHVYLWEFGKERATATYGVLPAANVPPPYALASISALQFDCFGHRFATAALDGTVCTWQLEVGGRSNVHPTQSSLCFNGHASDVAYVAASGSIIAAAGYSHNGVNLVIWDTLAPPATSQASLICHEGGARSLSVFDNDLGSGSISPLIVTGGKGGDVGLHDFRFIATGRTKRHRNSTDQSTKSSSMYDTKSGISHKFGEQNRNGMLWHIPKAHQGSVTKISTIPHTSLFLTGSKDGDVKLWDARGSEVELIFHWEKMHDRHTFLQPSSRGFGGVVRQAAVTDIQVLPHGFLTCGGDGFVRLVQFKDVQHRI